MKIVSLIQHPITIVLASDSDVVIEPSGSTAMVRQAPPSEAGVLTLMLAKGAVPVRPPRVEPTPDDVYLRGPAGEEAFPAPQPGVMFLVNALVLAALRGTGRRDVYAPDTGPTARRDGGNVTGVYGLIPVAP